MRDKTGGERRRRSSQLVIEAMKSVLALAMVGSAAAYVPMAMNMDRRQVRSSSAPRLPQPPRLPQALSSSQFLSRLQIPRRLFLARALASSGPSGSLFPLWLLPPLNPLCSYPLLPLSSLSSAARGLPSQAPGPCRILGCSAPLLPPPVAPQSPCSALAPRGSVSLQLLLRLQLLEPAAHPHPPRPSAPRVPLLSSFDHTEL